MCAAIFLAGRLATSDPTAHAEEIIIPLDFQRELVLVPRPAALAAIQWDAAILEHVCREKVAAQPKHGADPDRIAFDGTNKKTPAPLSDLAEVRVRPLTFLPQDELKELAARLAGDNERVAWESLGEVERLKGRAKNIVPLLLPRLKAASDFREVHPICYGLGRLGPFAAEAVPTLAEKLRTAEDLDKSWYAEALGHVGAPAVATLERLLRQESNDFARRAAARGLADSDAVGRRALRTALSDPNAEVRTAAVAVLPDDSDRETRRLVVSLLVDPVAGVRQAAAGKVSLCEPAMKGQALAALLRMLGEADQDSQVCALFGLGALHSRPEIVVPRIRPFLETRGEAQADVRRAALSAVEHFGPSAAALVPQVISCLDGDEMQTVRALESLEAIGGKPAATAAARVVALATNKDWRIADAATSALFTMGPDAADYSARVVALLSDKNVDTRQRLVGQALAAMGRAAKDALPPLASDLVSAGSFAHVPEEKVRWMAAIDLDGAVAAIQDDQRRQPELGDGFRVQDQRAGALEMLQHLKAHAAQIADQIQEKGQRRLKSEFNCLRSRDWPRVVRTDDKLQRVIALLGTPDSVGGGVLTYDAMPENEWRQGLRKIVVSVEHGKVTGIREQFRAESSSLNKVER